jgi:hypothetical protein
MKKISLFALALTTSLAVIAQDGKPARTPMEVKPRFGVKGGVNLASLEIDDDTPTTNFNTNSKTSFHIGVYSNIPLGTGMFRLQPEILYIGHGSKVTGTPLAGNQGTTQSYEVDMDYIAVPVMFQLATKGGFFVEAGPQFSFLTTARQDNATGSDPDLKDAEVIKKTDFAVLGGIGFTSRIGLGVHATYIHGITNVFDTDNASATSSPIGGEVSNRGIKIGLHYSFGAHK